MRPLRESILNKDYDISENGAAIVGEAIWASLKKYNWLNTGAKSQVRVKIPPRAGNPFQDVYSQLIKYASKCGPGDKNAEVRILPKENGCNITIYNKEGHSLNFRTDPNHYVIAEYQKVWLGDKWKLVGWLPIEIIEIIKDRLGLRY